MDRQRVNVDHSPWRIHRLDPTTLLALIGLQFISYHQT
jgi:hypothetical protein